RRLDAEVERLRSIPDATVGRCARDEGVVLLGQRVDGDDELRARAIVADHDLEARGAALPSKRCQAVLEAFAGAGANGDHDTHEGCLTPAHPLRCGRARFGGACVGWEAGVERRHGDLRRSLGALGYAGVAVWRTPASSEALDSRRSRRYGRRDVRTG